MSENNYQLYAWTENGEVKFSGAALWEQEMLLWDEYYSLYYSEEKGWERYSRLVHVAWQWGMLLLERKEYGDAYGRFKDGLFACRDAMRYLHIPEDGGVHPFLLAMDDLLDGCYKAVLEDDTLEEVYFEDSFRDIRRQLWEEAPTPENEGAF